MDACCRDHDHCDHIPAFSTKHGYFNYRPVTLSTCKCDKKFKNCLSRAGTFARVIDYFYSISSTCYDLDWFGRVTVRLYADAYP